MGAEVNGVLMRTLALHGDLLCKLGLQCIEDYFALEVNRSLLLVGLEHRSAATDLVEHVVDRLHSRGDPA
jgi:hypothetical protein